LTLQNVVARRHASGHDAAFSIGGGMDLKDFVTASIVSVLEGVRDAAAQATDSAEVAPVLFDNHALDKAGILVSQAGGHVHMLEFDVAVTANEGADTKAGIGVVAGVFNLGAGGTSTTSNSTVSRIKFRVPIVFPKRS
jgi:hypothetical protein